MTLSLQEAVAGWVAGVSTRVTLPITRCGEMATAARASPRGTGRCEPAALAASGASRHGRAMVSGDVLSGGAPVGRAFLGRRTWAALSLLALGIVVVMALVEVAPTLEGAVSTNVRLLARNSDGLFWVDVDNGRQIQLPGTAAADEASATDSAAVVQLPNPDRIFADSVVAFRNDEVAAQLGEADRVVPDPAGGLWLVLDSEDDVAGAVALTSVAGEKRSRLFTVPVDREIVGAVAGALVTLKGEHRGRQLQLWDPLLGQVVGRLGFVIDVFEVAQTRALVSLGCLNKGCSTTVIDTDTAKRSVVEPPPGWWGAGPVVLGPTAQDVAQVVTNSDGDVALALGPPQALAVVDTLSPAVGSQPVISPSGWIAVTDVDGNVHVWRNGQERVVELARGSQVVAIATAP